MQWCVVCDVMVFCASFGCGGVGLWADDSPRFPQKRKMPPRKPMGKGLNVPGNIEKAHAPPHKKVRKKQVGVIDPRAADDLPGVFPNLAGRCRDPLRRAELRLI